MRSRMLRLARMYRAYLHEDMTVSWLPLSFAARRLPDIL